MRTIEMRKIVIRTTIWIALLPFALMAEAKCGNDLPRGAEQFDVYATVALYSGKTWQWTDGGAYFAPDRKFTAVAGQGKSKTYGEGRWLVKKNGDLCFDATWYAKNGKRKKAKILGVKRDCFQHSAAGKTVYQRSEPQCTWYVFVDNKKKGEQAKLMSQGNTILEAFDEARVELNR